MSLQEQSSARFFQPVRHGNSSPARSARMPADVTARTPWLGFFACLLIAYLHPSMLWTPELPGQFAPLAVPVSLVLTGMWIAFGWGILRLSRLAPLGASITYALGRGGHLLYRWQSAGELEDVAIILVSLVLMTGLLISARAAFTAHARRRVAPV